MGRPEFSPDMVELKRRQLDERLSATSVAEPPEEGWIRSVRLALGMSAAQLGKRMGISAQSVTDMERREKTGRITTGTLAQAARALNCELRTVFVPRISLEKTVEAQADLKAQAQRHEVAHTMRLEAQGEGVDEALLLSRAREVWLTRDLSRLWD
jgi:predicted DNA-binding mobile mystery protein A